MQTLLGAKWSYVNRGVSDRGTVAGYGHGHRRSVASGPCPVANLNELPA
jgi:hypothetical protein